MGHDLCVVANSGKTFIHDGNIKCDWTLLDQGGLVIGFVARAGQYVAGRKIVKSLQPVVVMEGILVDTYRDSCSRCTYEATVDFTAHAITHIMLMSIMDVPDRNFY